MRSNPAPSPFSRISNKAASLAGGGSAGPASFAQPRALPFGERSANSGGGGGGLLPGPGAGPENAPPDGSNPSSSSFTFHPVAGGPAVHPHHPRHHRPAEPPYAGSVQGGYYPPASASQLQQQQLLFKSLDLRAAERDALRDALTDHSEWMRRLADQIQDGADAVLRGSRHSLRAARAELRHGGGGGGGGGGCPIGGDGMVTPVRGGHAGQGAGQQLLHQPVRLDGAGPQQIIITLRP